jgi:hypothetical protein
MKYDTYAFSLFITVFGIILMSIESILIKVANKSGLTYPLSIKNKEVLIHIVYR